MQLNFAQKTIAKDVFASLLVEGMDSAGKPAYSYVMVQGSKMPQFLKALEDGASNIEDYVIVIEEGEGPLTDEICQRIEDTYGLNHNYAEDLVAAVEQIKSEQEAADE